MKTRAIFAAAALLLGAVGCTDTLVEPKSTITSVNVFNDPASYKAFLAKLYGGLVLTGQQGPAGSGDIQGIDEGFSQYWRQYWQLQELPTDEALIGWGDQGLPELCTMQWASANQFVTAAYGRIFYQVTLANQFLRETTDSKLTERGVSDDLRATIQQYRAEARFLRALSYWHGLDLFGDIPLVDESFPVGATPPKQSNKAAIFAFIENELEDIQDDLPGIGAAQYGRADLGADLMLLSKLYMNAQVYVGQNRYSDARAAVEQVINSGAYQLDDRYLHLFLADNDDSPEIIFALPSDGIHTQTWGGMTFLVHAAIGGSMNAADYGVDGGWWGLRVTPQVVDLFGDVPNVADDRGKLFYTTGQTKQPAVLVNAFGDGYAYPKYRNVTSSGTPGSHVQFPDTDFPMFRLADAYLTYAEAVLRGGGGNATTALAYVNALRERAYRGTAGNVTSNQMTLRFILDERARELMWEGHRRTDLIRYGLFTSGDYVWSFKGNLPAGRATEAYRALYPIPAAEMLANPNLTQNTGY